MLHLLYVTQTCAVAKVVVGEPQVGDNETAVMAVDVDRESPEDMATGTSTPYPSQRTSLSLEAQHLG